MLCVAAAIHGLLHRSDSRCAVACVGSFVVLHGAGSKDHRRSVRRDAVELLLLGDKVDYWLRLTHVEILSHHRLHRITCYEWLAMHDRCYKLKATWHILVCHVLLKSLLFIEILSFLRVASCVWLDLNELGSSTGMTL